jgi:phosphatidylcholine synthase
MKKACAYAVHFYTSSGIVFLLYAMLELFRNEIRLHHFFLSLMLAVLIDATDGPLARYCEVETYAPVISGRTIDDIVDYLGFTFIPLILLWRMNWIPGDPDISWLFLLPPMITSLFAFSNIKAKGTDGFFLGFPSYWNIFAFYAGILHFHFGPWVPVSLLLILSILTVLPVRFLYPNLAPKPLRSQLLAGAAVWGLHVLYMLGDYPENSLPVLGLSLLYPAWYCYLSYSLASFRKGKIGPA